MESLQDNILENRNRTDCPTCGLLSSRMLALALAFSDQTWLSALDQFRDAPFSGFTSEVNVE